MYSRMSPLRHLHMDTSMLQTAHLVPEKPEFVLTYSLYLFNTDITVMRILLSAPCVCITDYFLVISLSLSKKYIDKYREVGPTGRIGWDVLCASGNPYFISDQNV